MGIAGDQHFHSGTGKKYDSFIHQRNLSILFSVLVIAAFFLFFRRNPGESVYVEAREDTFYIKACTGETAEVPYTDITRVELHTSFSPGEMVQGSQDPKVLAGTYRSEAFGEYSLFAQEGIRCLVVFTTASGERIAFNYESDEVTQAIFSSFPDLMESKGLSGEAEFVTVS